MVFRTDAFELTDYKITSNGFLNISGIVTRNGVFKYEDGGELRPDDEVFRADSLDTMFAIPVTWEHPPDLLTSETTAMYQKGIVASKPEVIPVNDNIRAVKLKDIIVQDPALIHEIIQNGLRQFSLGYTCDLDEQSGRFDSEDYVRVQRNIIYNHLAVVKDARCGKICSISKREDSMVKEYKKDCACQDKSVKKDAEDMPKAKSEVKEKLEEKKVDESEPSVRELASKIDEVMSMLTRLIDMEKVEAKEMKKEDDDGDKDLYDDSEVKEDELEKEVEEKEVKKDKRKDAINSFRFVEPKKRVDSASDFKVYTEESFLAELAAKRK